MGQWYFTVDPHGEQRDLPCVETTVEAAIERAQELAATERKPVRLSRSGDSKIIVDVPAGQMVASVVICPTCKTRLSKTVPLQYATADVFGVPTCPICGTVWTAKAALEAGVPQEDPSPGVKLPKDKPNRRWN